MNYYDLDDESNRVGNGNGDGNVCGFLRYQTKPKNMIHLRHSILSNSADIVHESKPFLQCADFYQIDKLKRVGPENEIRFG